MENEKEKKKTQYVHVARSERRRELDTQWLNDQRGKAQRTVMGAQIMLSN